VARFRATRDWVELGHRTWIACRAASRGTGHRDRCRRNRCVEHTVVPNFLLCSVRTGGCRGRCGEVPDLQAVGVVGSGVGTPDGVASVDGAHRDDRTVVDVGYVVAGEAVVGDDADRSTLTGLRDDNGS
jgi:hypothetical protein